MTRFRARGKLAAFLGVLRETGSVRRACEAAGVSRQYVYERRAADPEFAAAWDAALDEAVDLLEREAWRRAAEGVPRKMFNRRGEPVIDPETGEQYVERVYSDALLALLLRAHRPERYAERRELTGPGGGPIRVGISFEEALRVLREAPEPAEPPRAEPDADADDASGATGL